MRPGEASRHERHGEGQSTRKHVVDVETLTVFGGIKMPSIANSEQKYTGDCLAATV